MSVRLFGIGLASGADFCILSEVPGASDLDLVHLMLAAEDLEGVVGAAEEPPGPPETRRIKPIRELVEERLPIHGSLKFNLGASDSDDGEDDSSAAAAGFERLSCGIADSPPTAPADRR